MADIDRRLAAIAIRQHSLITLRDILALDAKPELAKRRCRSGFWQRVHPGVYRLAGVPWTYEARVLAAVLAAGNGAVASHLCAARIQGIGFVSARPELSIPRGQRCAIEGVTIHRSRDLDKCAVVERSGIPVTEPARTLLDVGRLVGPQSLARAVEAARRKDLVNWHDLAVCLAGHARQGRKGVRRLREVIAAGAANSGITDTDSELLALSLLREHGFDEPVLQHRVYDPGGVLIAEIDFAYPPSMIAFEIDGSVHLQPEVRRKDDARDDQLHQMGWRVRRIWWEIVVHQPEEFVRIVRDVLRTAAVVRP
ncbi:MAG: hypothetical protein QOJ00_1107 [Actinomycetota bacterium]|jgi:very-short-patch-repair endonuclease